MTCALTLTEERNHKVPKTGWFNAAFGPKRNEDIAWHVQVTLNCQDNEIKRVMMNGTCSSNGEYITWKVLE